MLADGFEIGVSQFSEIMPVAGVTSVRGLRAPSDLRTANASALPRGSEQEQPLGAISIRLRLMRS